MEQYYKKAEQYLLGKNIDLDLKNKEFDPVFNDMTLEQAKK